MIDIPGTGSDTEDTRLRAVRYFSDICAQRAPADAKAAQLALLRTLEAKSDAELEALGLLREDIVDHVFRDAHFV